MAENKEEKFHMWIGATLKAQAQKLAQSQDRSLASLIRYLIKKELNE